jgi:hypothetical protein
MPHLGGVNGRVVRNQENRRVKTLLQPILLTVYMYLEDKLEVEFRVSRVGFNLI